MMVAGISKKNRKLLDALNSIERGPFSIDEASEFLGLPREKLKNLLGHLARKGWLSRIKRGVYITVPLGTEDPKFFRENAWIVADKLFSPCYIGGWSAAEHWELTEQIFNDLVVVTTKRPRNIKTTIKGINYIIKCVPEKRFGATKGVWVENQKIYVSDPSQTIVDILDDPSIGGGIRNVADIIIEYFDSEHRNDSLLLDHIEKKGNRSIYKRLGYVIETLAIDATTLLETCAKGISTGFSSLDPSSVSKGHYNTSWKLRINVRIER